MTNVNMLRERINASGLKLSYIAEQLGIKYNTLMSKLSNQREFKITEILTLCKILEIDNEAREEIFFANYVDNESTKGSD